MLKEIMQDEKIIIKTYLDELAKSDELFAAKYANEKKSIDECWDYITGEMYAIVSAGKHGRAACGVLSHETVFQLAKHYYEEENIKITDFSGMAKVATSTTKTTEKPAKGEKAKEVKMTVKKTEKEEQSKQKAVQLNLFDF